MTKGNKKGHAGLIIFILILVLVIGGGTGFYFYQRQQPRKAVENFLDSMKKMDFNTMESMIQSSDLTALDNADIRDAAYTDFFSEINKKMTYKITRNRFDIQNGTASVTAHITYIDGTNIYKATITEFLRQIVSNAYAGNQLTEEETQAKLASILNEQAKKVEKDVFSETDITYPVIKTDSGWKIVSLDDETVKIMSANFKSVEEEINNSIWTVKIPQVLLPMHRKHLQMIRLISQQKNLRSNIPNIRSPKTLPEIHVLWFITITPIILLLHPAQWLMSA